MTYNMNRYEDIPHTYFLEDDNGVYAYSVDRINWHPMTVTGKDRFKDAIDIEKLKEFLREE